MLTIQFSHMTLPYSYSLVQYTIKRVIQFSVILKVFLGTLLVTTFTTLYCLLFSYSYIRTFLVCFDILQIVIS